MHNHTVSSEYRLCFPSESNYDRELTTTLRTHCPDKLLGTMMDIYGRCGKLDQAEALYDTINVHDVVKYGLLMKAYARSNRADQATEVIRKLLQDSHVEPSAIIFTSLIDAWAESSQSDAVEQAFSFLQLMEQDP